MVSVIHCALLVGVKVTVVLPAIVASDDPDLLKMVVA